jgi:hypothetical protein
MDGAGTDFRAGRQQPDDGERRHRFAGAGFADKAEGFSARKRQGHIVHDRRAVAEADGEVLDLKQGLVS